MAFDPFRGFIQDAPPSMFDVERRKKLADTLLSNRVQNGSQFGVLADALAGTLSGYENKQAAEQAQQGYEGANAALGAALSGDSMDPAALIQAGGNPFLPQSESGLVSDLIKRKMGIGETFYGTPQISFDENQQPHYSIIGSLGTVKEIKPPEGAGGTFSIKNQLVDTPTAAGVPVNPYSGAQTGDGVNKDNTQAELDKGLGSGIAKDILVQKDDAEGAGKLLNVLNEGESILDSGAYTGAGAGGKVALTKWAETLGIPVPQDAANNSQVFEAVMGQAVGQIIKQFGAGTGLSDADRSYARDIAGGNIELNEAAIRKILAIAKKTAQATIDSYNAQADSVQSGDVGGMLEVKAGPKPRVLTYNAATGELE